MIRTVFAWCLLSLITLAMPDGARAAGDDAAKTRSGLSRWNVAVVVYDRMEILDFAGPAEVFAAAAGGRAYRVYTVGESTRPVVSQGFVTITPQYTIDNCPDPDLIVIPGGDASRVHRSEKMMAWVKKESADARHLLSVCTGAFVLAKAGLLDGKEATTHHSAIANLRSQFPKVKVLENQRIVDNGKVLTTAGVSAGIDGALHVVAKMCGQVTAQKTAEYMEYRWQPDPALKVGTTDANTPERQALQAWFRGDWKQAYESYRQLAAKHPEDAIICYRLGVTESILGHLDEALKDLTKATELEPRNSDALQQLAQLQLGVKQPAKAAKTLQRAADLNKNDATLLYNLACVYALAGEKEKALQALEKAFGAGFTDSQFASADEDLQSIRDEPRFHEIVRKANDRR
jgi:transcriptional regulator GlxA family with amidase domain